nr:SigE family RNA polymerase sigma factor [Allorhizocola rhizosphaerae]
MDGAEESFHEYVSGRVAGLSRIAYLLTGDPHLAEDLVQQALIRVAQRWEAIRDDPDPYVRRVIYTQHVSWWRRHRADAVPSDRLPERSTSDPAHQISLRLSMREALARLAPRQRAVLILRYYEDLTEAQTAEVLGIAVGTVKSQTRDALARLRVVAPELEGVAAQ